MSFDTACILTLTLIVPGSALNLQSDSVTNHFQRIFRTLLFSSINTVDRSLGQLAMLQKLACKIK